VTSAPTATREAAWEAVIGLEVHCELATATKLFCGCPNVFGDEPNTNVCPVCLGLPGSLPVFNRAALELAMRIGLALGAEVRDSVFARKNYFYPDMPKDYQVSQYDRPVNVGGVLKLPDGTSIGVTRAHLEEDTGKSTHVGTSGRIHGADYALIDYNRAGVPLVEIVSEPDIRSADAAKAYINELRAILVAVGASDARMEEGSLRVDANVSVRPGPDAPFGTRAEVKNLNSVRSLGRAIEFEIARQIALLESGGRVIQETRHWDDGGGRTSSMRSKEEAEDYRYFSEPDLVPIAPDASWVTAVAEALPVLPAQRRAALADKVGLAADNQVIVTLVGQDLDALVCAATDAGADPLLAANRAANELATATRAVAVGDFVRLLAMETSGALTATQAKAVLTAMGTSGGDPAAIASDRGFEALPGDALSAAVTSALAAHPGEWERYRKGEAKLGGFFVGKVMAATGGKADGKAVTALLAEHAAR